MGYTAMNIYVGNLPTGITNDEVRKVFIAFGQVTSICIMQSTHAIRGQFKQYCFVEMASAIEGEEAVNSLNGKKLWGFDINVIAALPLSNKKDVYSL